MSLRKIALMTQLALLLLFVVLVLAFDAEAETWSGELDESGEPEEGEPIPGVSYLAVAGQALSEGDMPRTIKALSGARACWQVHETKCGFLREDYDALLGVLYLEYSEYDKAARTLERVLESQPQRRGLGLYLGEALYQLERYEEAARVLRGAKEAGQAIPGYFVLTARAELESGAPTKARSTLAEGLERFEGDAAILRELTLLYGRFGLFETAMDFARRYAKASEGDLIGYLLIADGHRGEKMYRRAAQALEEARLRDPANAEVAERLAYAYAEDGKSAVAARIFRELALSRPRFAYAASEQYRVAGRYREALRFNARVPNQRRRLIQKLNIYLASESFERATALYRPLGRARALTSPIRYRLSYAAVRAGNPRLAQKLLWRISTSGAARLREVIARCREEPWLCP